MVRVLQLAVAVLVLSQATQPGPSSRAALQPRNDDERAIAKHFSEYRKGQKPLQPGVHTGFPSEPGPPPPPPWPNEFDELRAAVCKTDLIATGHATASRVFFNAGETFLVTLYEFKIDTWQRMPASPQQTIQVALAGGEALLEGQQTSARVLPLYPLDGPVMMWLKRVPGSRAYGLVEAGMVTFTDDKPKVHFPVFLRLLWAGNQANVVTSIVNAAATCSGRRPVSSPATR